MDSAKKALEKGSYEILVQSGTGYIEGSNFASNRKLDQNSEDMQVKTLSIS